jgi:hypothetical protein
MEELNKYSKANPFKVPDGYFNNFQEKLKEKFGQEDNKTISKWKIHQIRPILAIAASVLLFFSLWFFLKNNSVPNKIISEEKTEQFPELKYFESENSDELIELASSDGLNSSELKNNADQDLDIVVDQLEESNIIDAI